MSERGEGALLEVVEVRKHFGGVRAVDGSSLRVMEGTITGLIGPNGAGKTTLFRCITGFLPLDGGEVRFAGERIDGLSPDRIFRRGMVRTFQITKQLERMTVLENVLVAARGQLGERALANLWRRGEVERQELANAERALALLESVQLAGKWDELAANLSGGEKRLLEFARVEMAAPRLVLLDEPSSGINPALKERLAELIRGSNRAHGRTFLIIGHDMRFMMGLCNPVYVMNQGRTLMCGTPEEVMADDEVLDVYLGR